MNDSSTLPEESQLRDRRTADALLRIILGTNIVMHGISRFNGWSLDALMGRKG